MTNINRRFLRNNEDVFVTRADKGHVSVFMDRVDYNRKMSKLLSDESTYCRLDKDPIKKLTSKTNQLIKSWREGGIIDEATYRHLNCTNGNLSRCYGLPKIHKTGAPLRIIVFAVDSSFYDVARWLHDVFQQTIEKPCSHVKDSW
ncbi:uncharacterized protein LOC105284345 [Ooceraea biroi]|uniref:uncharacterized protein LOC105284345 n=1 Tax=Ooceraea biroi TaxID=2015173 RepID=UPI0005BD4687|nr:uncharacterized protein LOC105284345 [Ooceraea biroi]